MIRALVAAALAAMAIALGCTTRIVDLTVIEDATFYPDTYAPDATGSGSDFGSGSGSDFGSGSGSGSGGSGSGGSGSGSGSG